MTRIRLLALAGLLIVTPAVAQVMIQPIQRPVAPQVERVVAPTEMTADNDLKVNTMTVEEARQKIFELYRERREINAKLTEALGRIDQMTKKGGTLVQAYCESPGTSRNTAGASENCGRYTCGEVSGLCKTSCSSSDDCSSGYSCDSGQCLTLGEVQARG